MQEAHDWLGMINAMSWSYDGSKRRDFLSENGLKDIVSKFGIMRVNVSICWNSDVNVKDRDYTCVCLAKDDVMGGMEVECRSEMESGSNCLKLSIEFRTDACYVVQYNSYQRMRNQTGNSLYHLSTAVSTSKNPVQASQVWRTEFEKILNSALEQ